MIRIKNIIAVLSALVLGTSFAIADGAQYEKLLEEGKAYEEKGQVIHALGAYWDAMEALPERNGNKALASYMAICNSIEKGKPGLGEFDDFSLYDGWVNLCKDYELYWHEHVNEINLLCFKWIKGELDMQTRTASYKFVPYLRKTPKYLRIQATIKKGYDGVWRKDWTDLPVDWPLQSVYKDSSVYPLVKLTFDYQNTEFNNMYTPHLYPQTSNDLSYISILSSFTEGCVGFYETYKNKKFSYLTPAWGIDENYGESRYGGWGNNSKQILSYVTTEMQFSILDNNDRVIAKLDKPEPFYDYPGYFFYNLTGISASDVKLLDSGNFIIRLDIFNNKPSSWIIKSYKTKEGSTAVDIKKDGNTPVYDLSKTIVWREPSIRKDRLGESPEQCSNASLEYDMFINPNTPNDVLGEAAIIHRIEENAFLQEIDGEICVAIDWNLFGIDGEKRGEDEYTLRYLLFRDYLKDDWAYHTKIKTLLEKIDSNYTWNSKIIYRPLTETERAVYEEYKAEEAKAEAEAEAKEIARILAEVSPEPKEYTKIMVDYSGYKISKYEVTQDLFEKLMGYNPSEEKHPCLPVSNLNFYEKMVFCNRLSIAAGLTPVYSLKNSTNPDDWGEIPKETSKKWDKAKFDKNANGYQVMDDVNVYHSHDINNGSVISLYDYLKKGNRKQDYFHVKTN